MKTSNQDPKNHFSKQFVLWEKFKNWLDKKPRRNAIFMAVILTAAFFFFLIRTYLYFIQPKQPSVNLYQNIQQSQPDSVAFKGRLYDSFDNYLRLLEIQDEIEKMQNNPNSIDTARINELFNELIQTPL